jgi:hypothetical protein
LIITAIGFDKIFIGRKPVRKELVYEILLKKKGD